METGFTIERLFIHDLTLQPESSDRPSESDDVFELGWDCVWISRDQFGVLLALTMHSTAQRPERLSVSYVAEFKIEGAPPTLDVERFACLNAPTIIMPYLRQALDDLTCRSRHGRLVLPPVNMQALSTDFRWETSTAAKTGRPAAATPD